ncbi:hypothetical protein N7456_008858 [Penicillium angulare]|uniref:Zn(2)-C6 fungal-type domain-containing protein n=1 Tax=Penicillium angulare TaxID=116970 RepID=A0A9W9F3P4_9EURO|nr:hypothetical protein N7456_008858 [Penicillium angulare]
MGSTSNVKPSRSRFGCRTCRARKVKCDERPGECGNCARLRLVCSGYGSSSNNQIRESPKERIETSKKKRTYRSCVACRASKTKCSGERPICRRCETRGHSCTYSETSQPSWVQRVESVSKDGQKSIPTPSLVADQSPSHHLEYDAMQVERPSSQSPISFQPSFAGDTPETTGLPLNWYIYD